MSKLSKFSEKSEGSGMAKFYIAMIVILVLATPAVWIIRSHFEAQIYERLTDKPVTTWEAMWVELRVEGC